MEDFFKEFGIKPKKPCGFCGHAAPCSECQRKEIYPTITPFILFEIMRILIDKEGHMEILPSHGEYFVSCGIELYAKSGETIARAILNSCLKHKDSVREEVEDLISKHAIYYGDSESV